MGPSNAFATHLEAWARGTVDLSNVNATDRALILYLERARTSILTPATPHPIAPELATNAEGTIADLALRLAKAWQQVMDPATERALDALTEAIREARHPVLVADLATLRGVRAALHYQPDGGGREEALRQVRRASRLTRTESMRPLEILANIALARMRRLDGTPHLGTRILSSVAALQPDVPWFHWEAAWAGVQIDLPESPARHLQTALRALARGNGSVFDESLRELSFLEGPFLQDVQLLRQGAGLQPSTHGFESGTGGLPPAMRALAALPDAPTPFRAAVRVHPARPPQRVLWYALALDTKSTEVLAERGARTLTALAVLAFEPGLDEAAFFARVYRFEFEAEKHRSALAVLLHRVRATLGERGTVLHDGHGLRLRCDQPFAFGDPRCARDDSERVLSLIAEGSESAKAIAARASLPLRSVQDVLKRLVEEGACTRQRNGRAIEYVLEDTTFQEPTDIGTA